MARAIRSDVGAARHAFDLGCDGGQHVLHPGVRLACAPGHDARSVQRTLLPARNASADIAEAQLLHRLCAPPGVLEERVAAVDDRVAAREHLDQRPDRLVDRRASVHHHEHRPWRLQHARQLLKRRRWSEVAFLRIRRHELFGPPVGAVVNADADPVRRQVAGQVHAHRAEPNHPHLLLRHLSMILHEAPATTSKFGGDRVSGMRLA